MTSRLVVTRGRNGTTVRATGIAAEQLFAAIAGSIGREVARPVIPSVPTSSSQPKHRPSYFDYLGLVRDELMTSHRLCADLATAKMDRDIDAIGDGFRRDVPIHVVAAAIAAN